MMVNEMNIGDSITAPSNPRFLFHRLRDVFMFYGFEYSELQRAVLTTLWGLWVANPFVSLQFTDPKFWIPVSRFVPIQVCGCLFLVCGVYQIWSVLINKIEHRRRAAFTAFLLWLFLWFLFIQVTFASTAVPLYLLFALENAWYYIRMRR